MLCAQIKTAIQALTCFYHVGRAFIECSNRIDISASLTYFSHSNVTRAVGLTYSQLGMWMFCGIHFHKFSTGKWERPSTELATYECQNNYLLNRDISSDERCSSGFQLVFVHRDYAKWNGKSFSSTSIMLRLVLAPKSRNEIKLGHPWQRGTYTAYVQMIKSRFAYTITQTGNCRSIQYDELFSDHHMALFCMRDGIQFDWFVVAICLLSIWMSFNFDRAQTLAESNDSHELLKIRPKSICQLTHIMIMMNRETRMCVAAFSIIID